MKVIDTWLARMPLESMADMPEMLIVGSLEDAARLRRKHSPLLRVVIFFPGLDNFYRERGAWLEYLDHGIRGIRVEPKRLSANMARLYLRGSTSPELAQRALQNLDQEIRDASERRAQEMDRLCRSAQAFDMEPPASSLGDFVKQVISSQFEYPEVLIREAVQNADGAWDKKLENRIDVVIDTASRMIMVSDQGTGMSPEVVESAFFNLYASLNEHLDYAAGRFGLGAASFFGADHEQVILDTRTREGTGAYVVVDSDLKRESYQLPRRLDPGTSLSIKLKASSPIDFARLESVLRTDCAYLETPIYLHRGGNSEQINIPLLPDDNAETVRIVEAHIQGHLRRCDGPGVLHIMCHRIRLSSIPTVGYSGAINCPALETTVSRDSVMDNPVLRHALEVVRLRAEHLLKPAAMDVAALSVRTRARLYRMFVMTHLLKDGAANAAFCRQNYGELVRVHNAGLNPKSLISGVFYSALSFPLIAARSVRSSAPMSAILEALRARFVASSRGVDTLAAAPLFLLTCAIVAVCCGIASAAGIMSGGSTDLWTLCTIIALFVLVPFWGLEIFFWWVIGSLPRAAARWAFHRALWKDGDWFRTAGPAARLLRDAAGLGSILLGLWVLACGLSSLVSSGSLTSLPRSLAVAALQAVKALVLDLERVPWTWASRAPIGALSLSTGIKPTARLPWTWAGDALVGALVLLALDKWRFHRKLQFSNAPLSVEQQALIDGVQRIVGANVPIGYSRGLTPAHKKAYFVGQRICLNPHRSLDLNAQQLAFSYGVRTRREHPPASKVACP